MGGTSCCSATDREQLDNGPEEQRMSIPDTVDGFARVNPPHGSRWPWPVYRRGNGPPVVLMHELMGLTPEVIEFGRRVAAAQFSVYLPVLFGSIPADTRTRQACALAQCCISRQINILVTGRTSRVVRPLRQLITDAAQIEEAPGVGVIGMCMSGGFALALATSPEVLAAVSAQPSLPYTTRLTPWCARDLGMSDNHVTALNERLQQGAVEVYLTRFSEDRKSPLRRQETLLDRIGDQGITLDVLDSRPDNAEGFTTRAHSVLSVAPTQYPSGAAHQRLEKAACDVLAFLSRRLKLRHQS
jgi:dienelactone hydrolase